MNTFELNNIHRDADSFSGKFTKNSPIVEVFSAMVNGEELGRFGAKADKAVNYIKNLGERAGNGDYGAVAELNTLRRFVVEAPVLEEMKLLGIFGSYKNVGFDETIQREVYTHVGEPSAQQAANGDVPFIAIHKDVYDVPTFTVSGGYAVDYRRVAMGDMSKENEGIAHVKTDILNNARKEIVKRVYNAINNATGVAYKFSAAGLTKAGADGVINAVRRNGKPTVFGDWALLSQFTPWAGYVGSVASKDVVNVSEQVMNEIAANGLLSTYNGAILAEIQNPYDEYDKSGTWTDGAGTYTNFKPLFPIDKAFVVPTGVNSPIATWTRGGLTSLTGNDIKTGEVLTRFDIEVACDVAKGQEYKIGILRDTNLG